MIFGTEPLQSSGVSNTLLLNLSRSLSVQRRRLPEALGPLTEERATIRDLARQVLKLRQFLDRVGFGARLIDTDKSAARAAAVTSDSPLDLNLQPTFTTLSGSEEVNTTPTSFSPFSPSFNSGSTAVVIIGGVYNGEQGDDTLRFTIKKTTSEVGVDKIDVEVKDGAGNKIETIKFDADDSPGTVKTLQNGLTLSFSAGITEKNDIFTLDVFASVGSVVEPDKPFNGTGNDNPNF